MDSHISEELEKRVQRRNYPDSMPSFDILKEVYRKDVLDRNVEAMSRTYNISLDTPVEGKGFGSLFRKFVRKLLRFLYWVPRQEQKEFNTYTLRSVSQLRMYCENNEVEKLRERVSQLEKEIEELKNGQTR